MKDIIDLERIDAAILCGGLGTRLKSIIFGEPKILAKIEDQKFIDIFS